MQNHSFNRGYCCKVEFIVLILTKRSLFVSSYFRYKQFNKDVITVVVGYYLRYALSYRDISEILGKRGVNV